MKNYLFKNQTVIDGFVKSPELSLNKSLRIVELAGHNIESKGRETVNKMLKEGWVLLLVYTLKFEKDGLVRERPMAILGRPQAQVSSIPSWVSNQ